MYQYNLLGSIISIPMVVVILEWKESSDVNSLKPYKEK